MDNFKHSIYIIVFAALANGCGKETPMRLMSSTGEVSQSSTFDNPNIGAGGGAKVAGLGAFSVPTRDAIVARLEIGLENNAKSGSGNFARALTQVKSNLPKQTDPTKVTGLDQVQLLVYGACSDLTTGNTPSMKSKYNVDPVATIATNQTALINAGVKMLDKYVAGLATESNAAATIRTALNTLTAELIASGNTTSTIAFMAVCIAVNTAGSSMMGF